MKNHKKITKAIITAAGYGTRFLPATKNQPKEMLPIVDKPIILYLVEEAVKSGIEDIIIVTRYGLGSIEDFFDNHYEIESTLEKNGKLDKLDEIREITKMANFIYVRQKKHLPYGNATPLLAAQSLIDDDEAFVYMFGDDMTISETPVTKQLIDVYQELSPSAVLAVQEVSPDEIDRYASIKYKENGAHKYEMEEGLEKVSKEEAPSYMAQFGRFVFSYDVIEQVKKTSQGKDNELWLIDVLNGLAKSGKQVIAQPIEGEWLTTGDPLRYIKTTLKFAMQRDDLAPELKEFFKEL